MKYSNEIKVGILAFVALTVLIVGFNFLKGSDLFSHTNKYYAIYEKVDGLTVSKPVMVNGFQIGRVSEMKLLQDGQIMVRFDVDQSYLVPVNTNAKLESNDILGNKIIVFVLGSSHEIAHNGDTLSSSSEKSLSETVAPLQVKTERLLTRIDSLLGTINAVVNPKFQRNIDRSINSVANTLETLETFAKTVNSQTPKIEAILKDVQSMTDNLKNNNANITAVIKNFRTLSDNTAKADFAGTLNNANNSIKQLNAVMEKINTGKGSLGQLINDKQLYNNLNTSAVNLNSLMIDLKANPKRYVSFSIFGGKSKPSAKKDTVRKK